MNEKDKILTKDPIIAWRRRIIGVDYFMFAFCFVVELAMFIQLFLGEDFGKMSIGSYFLMYVLKPTGCSFISCLVVTLYEKVMMKKHGEGYRTELRNFMPLFVMWLNCYIISYTHYIFVLTLVVYALPIAMSVAYMDKFFTSAIGVMSVFGLLLSNYHAQSVTGNAYLKEYMWQNIAISVGLIITFCLVSQKLIEILVEKNNMLQSSAEEAKRANTAKTNFLINISHEVRTPVSAIIGMNEMVLRESEETTTLEHAADIDSAANSILVLLNEMVDMSKIETGKLEVKHEDYSVYQMIYAAVNFVYQRAKNKNLKFETSISEELPTTLNGDSAHILQVITNLLTNAVKYTDEGSIKLVVDGFEREDEYILQVAIEDTGIGIKQEEIDNLFDSFDKLNEEKNDNVEGTGLGLAVCNRILKMMDSSISVISDYGKGSTFSFKVNQKLVDDTPIGEFMYTNTYSRTVKHSELGLYAPGARIIVVDDNEINLKLFSGLLASACMKIDEAISGPAALKLMSENHYDLVFLDHLMPGMDGVETLHHIRDDENSLNRMSPVVMLTANAMIESKDHFIQEGFDDFLSKPVVTEKLVETINNLLDPELLLEKPENSDFEKKETNTNEVLLPNFIGQDWDRGIVNCGTRSLLISTVIQFNNSISSDIEFLGRVMRYDREQYRIRVHSIKSVAATVGNETITVLARLLEFAAKDGSTETMERLHPSLVSELEAFKKNIAPIIESTKQPDKETASSDIVAMELNTIKAAMLELDTDIADEAMERINKYRYEDALQKDIDELTEAVNNLDDEKAVEICDKLIAELFPTGEGSLNNADKDQKSGDEAKQESISALEQLTKAKPEFIKSMEEKKAELDEKFDSKRSEIDDKIESRRAEINEKVETRIEGISDRIDDKNKEISEKIDNRKTEITDKFEELEEKRIEEIEKKKAEFERRKAEFEAKNKKNNE